MTLQQLFELFQLVATVAGVGVFLYFYFTNPRFKEGTKTALKFLPAALQILISRIKDKPNEFDTHDFLVLVSNIVAKIKETVSDPANVEFDDVEDEIVELVEEELERLRASGISGVPNLDESSLTTIIHIIFTQIKAVADED